MAKFSEYRDDGNLGAEINDAAGNQRARDSKGRFIPDRFVGKDIGDVVQSYEELEKMNSRQSQDLGDMRRTVDQLLEINASNSPAVETSIPLSAEDIYENPDASVRRVAREESSSEITALRNELNQLQKDRKFDELETVYPEWQTRSNSPEFRQWAEASPYRVRIATAASKGDFDAAEEILGMYYASEVQAQVIDEVDLQQQQATLSAAMLETGSPAPVEMVDTYSRSDLMETRIAANKGDLKADRWLKAHGQSITDAYAEGRIVD